MLLSQDSTARVRAPHNNAYRNEWTPDRVGELIRLWTDGVSCSLIAERLGGISRNAVIGKVNRMNLPMRKTVLGKPRPRAPRKRYQTSAASPTPVVMICDADIPVAQRKTLMQLTSKHCRWPVGNPGDEDFFFCGGPADVARHRPYCDGHTARAFGASAPRTNKNIRLRSNRAGAWK